MSSWVGTSNGYEAALVKQWAIEKFGYEGSIYQHDAMLLVKGRKAKPNSKEWRDYLALSERETGFTRASAFKALDRQYEFTQYALRRRGVEDIVLHRGASGEGIRAKLPLGRALEVENRVNPVSSWSTNRGEAKNFANWASKSSGYVATATIHRSQILATPHTKIGTELSLSKEVLVIARPNGKIRGGAERPKSVGNKRGRGVVVDLDSTKEGSDWLRVVKGRKKNG